MIGLRGHARNHIDNLSRTPNVVLDKVFYHKNVPIESKSLPVTNSLAECLTSDAIIVSTPTESHIDFIRQLSNYDGYILLEKPAVNSLQQIRELCALPKDFKQRIRVNFNFQFHKLAYLLHTLKISGDLGKIFAFDVHTSHGVAFRTDWNNTWRVDNKTGLGPMETTGIHYVQFSLVEFGSVMDSSLRTMGLSGRPAAVDTGILNMTMSDGTEVRIRHSYASPYAVRFELWGTNAFLTYDGSIVKLYHPRDTFDSQEKFASPPVRDSWNIEFQQAWMDSLENSQSQFLNVVMECGQLDPDEFDRDVSAMSILLN